MHVTLASDDVCDPAPRITLVLILWALVAGGLVLFPSLVYLLRVFKREHAGP